MRMFELVPVPVITDFLLVLFSYSVPIFYFCPIGPLVRYTTVFNFYKK